MIAMKDAEGLGGLQAVNGCNNRRGSPSRLWPLKACLLTASYSAGDNGPYKEE